MAEEYETIEAPFTYDLDDGETFENKLIDLGDRNRVVITAKGSNWTIRNIGFTGTAGDDALFGVCDSGSGTSTMENIFFSEGDPSRSPGDRPIQIWVDPDHSGHMDVRNVYFGQAGANGIYGSAPAYNGNGGTIALENCYGNDNHHTSFRIGDNGSSITNCVSYKSGDRAANRSVWIWEGDYDGAATLTDVHCITNGTGEAIVDRDSPEIDMENVYTDDGSGTHDNPEHFVPEACPESAEEAAGGSSDGSDGDTGNGSDGDEDDGDNGEEQPWAGDENFVESANGDNWETRVTANFEEGSGSYTFWSDEPIKQGYWYSDQPYNPNVQFGNEEFEDGTFYYANGNIEGELDGLLTDGGIAGLAAEGDGYEFWYNGTQIQPDDYPNMPGEDAPNDGNGDEGDGDEDEGDSSEYEVVQARGQTITLGDGDTWENKLVDLTTGEGFLLHITGAASVRNVGFSGLYRGGNFLASISAPSGTVIFENIYAGDGATKEGTDFTHGAGGFFYHKDAGADVDFHNCHVAGFPNNGFYCSNSPSGGTVRWNRCYGVNNGVSTYRCGGEGDRIENCVAYNDDTDYGEGYETDWVESSGRPVWVWPGGDVEIVDSHFAAGNYPYSLVMRDGSSAAMSGGALEGDVNNGNLLSRTDVGSSADLNPPEGVPMSPTEAASGGDEDGGTPTEPPEEEPEPPTKDEQIEMLEQEVKQLEDQIADYEAAFEEMESIVDEGESSVPFLSSMWEAIRDRIPTTGGSGDGGESGN